MRQTTAAPPAARGTTSMCHSGRERSSRSANRRATSARSASSSQGSTSAAVTCAAISNDSSSTQTGRSAGPASRRVNAGAAGSRSAIDAASRSELGAPSSISTTLQVCPATAALSSARIARSSSVRAMSSIGALSRSAGRH